MLSISCSCNMIQNSKIAKYKYRLLYLTRAPCCLHAVDLLATMPHSWFVLQVFGKDTVDAMASSGFLTTMHQSGMVKLHSLEYIIKKVGTFYLLFSLVLFSTILCRLYFLMFTFFDNFSIPGKQFVAWWFLNVW